MWSTSVLLLLLVQVEPLHEFLTATYIFSCDATRYRALSHLARMCIFAKANILSEKP